MNKYTPLTEELIAPCGMNCRLCYGYIRPRNQCLGCCAPEEGKPKSCSSCKIVTCDKRIQNGWQTCAPCDTPCRRLKDLDKRYQSKYHMSMIQNLAAIRDKGMQSFCGSRRKSIVARLAAKCSAYIGMNARRVKQRHGKRVPCAISRMSDRK